jgi:hypothetical protein
MTLETARNIQKSGRPVGLRFFDNEFTARITQVHDLSSEHNRGAGEVLLDGNFMDGWYPIHFVSLWNRGAEE